MKKILIFLTLFLSLTPAFADTDPIVGLWTKIPVSFHGYDLTARTSYIFTNKKLTESTVFVGTPNDDDAVNLICCIEVKNITPLDIGDILRKYGKDAGFVEHMKSIKGLNFMYQAVPVKRSEWSKFMTTIMNIDDNPDDLSPYTTPVISAKLGLKDENVRNLELSGKKSKLKIKYTNHKNTVVYEFLINGKKVIFSEDSYPAE